MATTQPTGQLARTIIVAARAAGGTLSRQQIHDAFRGLAWLPTVGEISAAIRLLDRAGLAEVTPGKYFDSVNTTIHAK